jgi:hypothetical protein
MGAPSLEKSEKPALQKHDVMGSKISEYDICSASTSTQLVEFINDWIKLGWLPIGGIMYDKKTDLYRQAIVKEKFYCP